VSPLFAVNNPVSVVAGRLVVPVVTVNPFANVVFPLTYNLPFKLASPCAKTRPFRLASPYNNNRPFRLKSSLTLNTFVVIVLMILDWVNSFTVRFPFTTKFPPTVRFPFKDASAFTNNRPPKDASPELKRRLLLRSMRFPPLISRNPFI
jgi:hypothetical protein